MTDEFGAIGLAGPKSLEVLAKVTSSDLSDESFPFLSYQEIAIGSVTVKAIRISYTGIYFIYPTFCQDQTLYQFSSLNLPSCTNELIDTVGGWCLSNSCSILINR